MISRGGERMCDLANSNECMLDLENSNECMLDIEHSNKCTFDNEKLDYLRCKFGAAVKTNDWDGHGASGR